jgi:hypothetical protein
MRNLKEFDILEMSTAEMKVLSGGGGWFERVWNCTKETVKQILQTGGATVPA